MRHRRWPAKSSVPVGVYGGLVLAGTALLTFQGGLLRVALPVIRADLDAGIPAIQLVSLAGPVVVTITLVTFGRRADLLGPGRIYIWGLLGVALGSVLAAYHMAVAVGLGAGPAGGGLLIDVIGWRGALALTVLLAVPLAATLRSHAPSEGSRGRLSVGRFDLAGAALLGLALAALLLLVRRPTWIPLPIPVVLGAAVASFAAFLVRELRTGAPLVDLRLFARRGFSAGLAATFLNFIAMAANMFLMPFFSRSTAATAPPPPPASSWRRCPLPSWPPPPWPDEPPTGLVRGFRPRWVWGWSRWAWPSWPPWIAPRPWSGSWQSWSCTGSAPPSSSPRTSPACSTPSATSGSGWPQGACPPWAGWDRSPASPWPAPCGTSC